ncbi:TetR/AcrR family transcriptional regulator [Bradyrhizobium mercantei]|uniref:TetR/AcrR family transcriptional regulator n=1 Tax=Bradyrhizobium mercantei TaxID=1904807 RepID=UPI00135647A9|nr:TetR family transcriptional regulator [Bradyrhizobium mercantei]
MLDGFEAEGVRPAQQQRSRKLIIDLFNEALVLLNDVDFDGLSIDSLCVRASSTVGAFYSRFENKEAFVGALQRMVVIATRQGIDAAYAANRAPSESLESLINWITKGAVAWFRRYEGIIRASLRRANDEADTWIPMREVGTAQISHAVPRILSLLHPDTAAHGAEDRIRFAFQMLFGTLNNMILLNPGPFGIHQAETPQMLASAMIHFIQSVPTAAPECASRRPELTVIGK